MKTKPKKLWHFFLKRWIILLVSFTIIALLGTRIYYEFITTTRAYEDDKRTQNTIAALNTLDEFALPELIENHIMESMCRNSDNKMLSQWGVESAMILLDDKGDIMLSSEKATFAVHYTNNVGNVYRCADTSLLDLEKEYSQKNTNVLIDIEDIYIKDTVFLPGKVSITPYSDSWQPFDVIKKDLTPNDVSGCTHITEKVDCYIYGTSPESSLYKELIEAVSPQNIENFDTLTAYLPDGIIRYASMANIDINGAVYTLYELRTHDFYAVYGKNFLIIYVILFVLSIGTALLTAAFSYSKYRTRYNNEQYRRTITDTMAHDLKSPLTAISGYAENLMENLNTDKREYYADAILGNVRYMNDIITNVLELSRLESKCSPMQREDIDLVALARDLYQKYEPQAEEKCISAEIAGSCIISADRQLMTKTIDNLLSNAVKYTKAGEKITITAESKSFIIANSSAEDTTIPAEQLTEPFVKGDLSRSSKQGSGLGLSIVKNILDMHGYSMKISTDSGKFSVKLTF